MSEAMTPTVISVQFKKAALNTDGSIGEVTIFDAEGNVLRITANQARSLSDEIRRKLHDES